MVLEALVDLLLEVRQMGHEPIFKTPKLIAEPVQASNDRSELKEKEAEKASAQDANQSGCDSGVHFMLPLGGLKRGKHLEPPYQRRTTPHSSPLLAVPPIPPTWPPTPALRRHNP
ncbi:MAG: hypothetical protein F4153_11385 [Acidimicrobiia bacterium]|nr:hypothetical protein [Acidimicrobiia bacterium]